MLLPLARGCELPSVSPWASQSVAAWMCQPVLALLWVWALLSVSRSAWKCRQVSPYRQESPLTLAAVYPLVVVHPVVVVYQMAQP